MARLAGANHELEGRLDLSGAHGEAKQVRALKKRVADLEQQKRELQSEPNEIRWCF